MTGNVFGTIFIPVSIRALRSSCVALAVPAPASGEAAGRTLREAPLIGRTGPLATLRHAFARAQAGQTQVVVLQGEAGMGRAVDRWVTRYCHLR